MKLLTLNTHSLVKGDGAWQASVLAEAILEERFDVIALQEVNQRRDGAVLDPRVLENFTACSAAVPLREGNFAHEVVCRLGAEGERYHWCYLPVKIGYGKYDEGLAFLCRAPIASVDSALLSLRCDYGDWKTRRMLSIQPQGGKEWFFNVHLGWWDDPEEPFVAHWIRLLPHLWEKQHAWVMGDFNSSSEVCGEGYDLVKQSGLYDAYEMAKKKIGKGTAEAEIDGWHGRTVDTDALRIDQIWASRARSIRTCRTLFDGERYPVISDHFGVAIETED